MTAGKGATAVTGLDPAVCNEFLDDWQAREAELAPGQPLPPRGEESPCYDCIGLSEGDCGLPQSATCAAATDCVFRHCLCSPATAAACSSQGPPSDLCACIADCLPLQGDCAGEWNRYMACSNDACSRDCG